MMSWNQYIFLLLNASSHPDAITVGVAKLTANWLVVAAALVIAYLWIWGPASKRDALIAVGASAVLALGINQFLGLLWFEPRPFMVGLGHTLMSHPPDNSFPSDHATFMWTLGFGLIATRASRRLGGLVTLAGVVVAWARIYLGVHFPVDMIGSFIVAMVSAAIARAFVPVAQRWLLPVIEGCYEATLIRLCLRRSCRPKGKPAID
jgi:undecaprenyl-diphosphatase